MPDPPLGIARLVALDLTSLAGNATGPSVGGPIAGMKATTIAFEADPNNAATVFVGGGGGSYFPLTKGTGVVMDAQRGYAFDLSEISLDGKGTAGLVVHILAAVVG